MASQTAANGITTATVPPPDPLLPTTNPSIIMFPIGIFRDENANEVSRTTKAVKVMMGSPAYLRIKIPKEMNVLLDEVVAAPYEIVTASGKFTKESDVIYLTSFASDKLRREEATAQANRHRLWENDQVTVNDGVYSAWVRQRLQWEWEYVLPGIGERGSS